MHLLINLSLSINTSQRMSTYFLIVDAPTLNRLTICVALNPWANQWIIIVKKFIISNYGLIGFKQLHWRKVSIPKLGYWKLENSLYNATKISNLLFQVWHATHWFSQGPNVCIVYVFSIKNMIDFSSHSH
jgi:hypothetical protein